MYWKFDFFSNLVLKTEEILAEFLHLGVLNSINRSKKRLSFSYLRLNYDLTSCF